MDGNSCEMQNTHTCKKSSFSTMSEPDWHIRGGLALRQGAAHGDRPSAHAEKECLARLDFITCGKPNVAAKTRLDFHHAAQRRGDHFAIAMR